MKPVTIVVVDDHPLFRQGVIDTLSLEPDLTVIGEATDGGEALEKIRQLAPEIAVLDVNLPGMNGQQITRQVVSEKLPTRVILLTAYDDAEQKLTAMRIGAAGYCVKDVRPETLAQMVREVAAGNFVVSGEVFRSSEFERWLELEAISAASPYQDLGESFEPLSAREMEVLALMTRGLSNKEIATSLGISHQTVKNHVTAILRKLCVEDRTQAALYALRRGWVRLHDEKKEVPE